MCARASLSLSLSLCGCVRAHVRVSLSLTVTFSLPLPPPPSLSVCVCVCVRQHGCTCACACVWGGHLFLRPGLVLSLQPGLPLLLARLFHLRTALQNLILLLLGQLTTDGRPEQYGSRTVRQGPDGTGWGTIGGHRGQSRPLTRPSAVPCSTHGLEAILSLARLIRRAVSLHRSTAAPQAFLRPFLSPPPTPPV